MPLLLISHAGCDNAAQHFANDAKGRRMDGQCVSTCMVRGVMGEKGGPVLNREKSGEQVHYKPQAPKGKAWPSDTQGKGVMHRVRQKVHAYKAMQLTRKKTHLLQLLSLAQVQGKAAEEVQMQICHALDLRWTALYTPRSHTAMRAQRVIQFTLEVMQDDTRHMLMDCYKVGTAMANVEHWIRYTEQRMEDHKQRARKMF